MMRKYFLLVCSFFLAAVLFSQSKQSPASTRKFGLHVGVGMQGDVYKSLGRANGTRDYTRWDIMPNTTSLAHVYLDLGGVVSRKRFEIGGAVRLAVGRNFLMEKGRDSVSIDLMPSLWSAWYFGKSDGRAFRIGANLTPVIYHNFFEANRGPSPGDRVPPVGSTTTFWAFGATFGTRIIRSGWFKETYVNVNPQISPPSADDKILFTGLNWYWRVNAGLTKNINFRK